MAKRFRTVGMGGTFDHLHAGHQHFITHAAQLAETVLIGITVDDLTKKKPWAASIEPLETRWHQVRQFCRQKHIKAELFELRDPVGPTLEKGVVNALCVTPETEQGAAHINTLRQKLLMRPLPVFICPYWKTTDGEVLHSQAIREGRLSPEGVAWESVFTLDQPITAEQRTVWQEPQGELVKRPVGGEVVTAVVGDYCLEYFHTQKWPYHLGIFDQKTERSSFESEFIAKLASDRHVAQVSNPAGIITKQLVTACLALLPKEAELPLLRKKPHHLSVDGEEDLAAVVLQLLLPLNSVVYYGQRDQGMVAMRVTLGKKQQFFELLQAHS